MNDDARNIASSPIRILLVEDNEHDRVAFESALRNSEAAFEISVCERAEEALQVLPASKESFDLVVINHDLPGMTGMEFYRRIQHMKKLPSLVMLINVGSENLAVEALRNGIHDYIIKDTGLVYLKLLPLKLADVERRKSERVAGRKARAALKKAHDELEKGIVARTAALSLTIQALEAEVVEHQKAREEISIAYDALNSATSGIVITDLDFCIRFANPACLRMFNYDTLSDIIGMNASGLFSAEKDRKFSGIRMVVQQYREQTQDLIVQCSDGKTFPVEISFSEVTNSVGVVVGKMASLIDITERKKTEAALLDSEKRLRELSRKILASQENERKLVAQEIHDSITGGLEAIKISLEQKLHNMKSKSTDSSFSLEKIISMTEQTIQETRRISAHLRPSMLDDLGLFPTVDWFCREFEKHYPEIQVVRRLEFEESDVADQLKVVIYRILQEAMNNVAKHSGANRVQISLVKSGNEVILSVQDSGCGFDLESIRSNPDPLSGYGLSNMQDRAEICGGKLEISSKPETGTTVQLTLPCDSMSPML